MAIDRGALYQRLTELELLDDLGDEYDALCWARDLLYMLDEGIVEMDDDGKLYLPDA